MLKSLTTSIVDLALPRDPLSVCASVPHKRAAPRAHAPACLPAGSSGVTGRGPPCRPAYAVSAVACTASGRPAAGLSVLRNFHFYMRHPRSDAPPPPPGLAAALLLLCSPPPAVVKPFCTLQPYTLFSTHHVLSRNSLLNCAVYQSSPLHADGVPHRHPPLAAIPCNRSHAQLPALTCTWLPPAPPVAATSLSPLLPRITITLPIAPGRQGHPKRFLLLVNSKAEPFRYAASLSLSLSLFSQHCFYLTPMILCLVCRAPSLKGGCKEQSIIT